MKRKYRIQGAWIIVSVFLIGHYYWWSITPGGYFYSPLYWTSYFVWAIVGGWGLLPKKIGTKDQTSRLNPLWVGVAALVLIVGSKWVNDLNIIWLGFIGLFGGMAIRTSAYLLKTLISSDTLARLSKRETNVKKPRPSVLISMRKTRSNRGMKC